MNKIISIIIASYNVEDYLERNLSSIVKACHRDEVEAVVINDGSTDGTLAIAQKFQTEYPEVVKVINKPNGHYGSCINAALKIATGKYFRIVDADDWVGTEALDSLIERLQTSDVDLAIASTENLVTPLQLDFDQSQLPFTFDLIDYRRQPNQKLKDAIDREGKLLWAVDGKGEWMMTKEQLRLKCEDYHKALNRLEIALTKTLDEDDLYLDATIQRFEFTFELAWKLMKAVLDYEGIEATSPRSRIREAWKQHLIGDAEKWLDMQVKRNLSFHTYNEETAQDIYRHIKEDYIGLLQVLDQEVRSRLDI